MSGVKEKRVCEEHRTIPYHTVQYRTSEVDGGIIGAVGYSTGMVGGLGSDERFIKP